MDNNSNSTAVRGEQESGGVKKEPSANHQGSGDALRPPGRPDMRPEYRPISDPLGPIVFALLSVPVGLVAGLGAVVFRAMIAVFHNLLFLGRLSWSYDANAHTPESPWGPWVILVPVVGGLGVAFLVQRFAPEAKGHGVPEVMDAIYHNRGIIRPVVAVIKSLASALSIGSGGSVGREGPIIQTGASFGSSVGQIIPMSVWQRNTLIAAGAGGGIAATFNTPVGGILFALELMMVEISVRTLVPVTLATMGATYIGRLFFGPHPSFVIPALERPYFQLASPWGLASYFGLGLGTGLVSALFIVSLYGCEDILERRIPGNYYSRHALGMLVVGVMMYVLNVVAGHYYIEGVGYAAIQDVLEGSMVSFPFLLLLLGLKLLATSLTLGSGASGGVFSPSLFMGAMLGGSYGVALNWLFPGSDIAPPAFAVAGMAGIVGGATGAALAAIVMIFEMTLDYTVIIPMTITVAVSYATRRLLLKDSIYTRKLARRGALVPQTLQANVEHSRLAKELMDTHMEFLPASARLGEVARSIQERTPAPCCLIEDDKRIRGVLPPNELMTAMQRQRQDVTLADLADPAFATVSEDATLYDVLVEMRRNSATVSLITRGGQASSDQVVGVLTKWQIADALLESIELFSE
jgi:CIC family chloride channel protein